MGDVRTSPLQGRRPVREELASFTDATLDDVRGPDPVLLIVGINPGLWTAAVNAPFAHPGNRFWPALAGAGITPWQVDASRGLAPADEAMLIQRGIAMTNLVPRATARADALTQEELRAGAGRITALAEEIRPQVVVVVGITAHRVAFHVKRATLGRQPEDLAGAQLWVLPQPSGLNAHAPLPVLIDWWRQVGDVTPLRPVSVPPPAPAGTPGGSSS